MNPQTSVPEGVRNLGYIIKEIGLSTVVVLFLLGQNAGWIPSPNTDDHRMMFEVLAQNQKILTQNQKKILMQVDLQQAMCLNAAENELQEARCRNLS